MSGEPFVRSRLKRVFPRVPQDAAKSLEISATPENTRELKWFLQRYPMIVDRPDEMERLAQQHVDTELRMADLMAGHIPPGSIALAIPAREYQLFAAQMLEIVEGYLLADDLGLGKSVSAICPMLEPKNLPALVVCPAHLPGYWQYMIHKFAPDLKTHILKTSQPYDLVPQKRGRKRDAQMDLLPAAFPDVIITSYHKLRGWAETLAGVIRYCAFDEAQALRSPGTAIYAAAELVAAASRRRLALSATPIYNYGNEFFHVIRIVAPNALGEYREFLREWCTSSSSGKTRLADPIEFGAYLRREGIMLRRTRGEVGRELPKLTKVIHEVESDSAPLDALDGNAIALARIVLRHNEQFRGQKMQAAGEFDALMRQATGIAKAPYVAEFVRLLLDSGEPIVLFGWHRAVYEIWREHLADFSPVFYTGSESNVQKTASLDAFVSGRSQLLIMSLRSGAGVDGLQFRSRIAVFGELDWSPMVHEQCIGRLDRDGQVDPCTAYFLLSTSGADPIMAEVLGIKRHQIESVRNPGGALAERLDNGENNLLRLAREFLIKRGELFDDGNSQVSDIGRAEPAMS